MKIDLPMPCKTKSRQSSKESVRTVHAIPPDTPRPPTFNLKLSKNGFCEKVDFQLFCSFWSFLNLIGPHGNPWEPMGTHGFPWVPMGPHGRALFPWRGHDSVSKATNLGLLNSVVSHVCCPFSSNMFKCHLMVFDCVEVPPDGIPS